MTQGVSCGNRGCLQALASGQALARDAGEAITAGTLPPDSTLRGLVTLTGGAGVPLVTGATVGGLASAGDAGAQRLVRRCGYWLGVGLGSLVNLFDPALIVVAGGPALMGDLLLGPARDTCYERIVGRSFRAPPPIEGAAAPADASLTGAALLAARQYVA